MREMLSERASSVGGGDDVAAGPGAPDGADSADGIDRADGTDGIDGRSARRARGRAATVAAVVSLFDDGDLRPSAEAIVARAGVSSASLFRYFPTLDDLYRAAFEQKVALATELVRVDDPTGLGFDERVAEFISGRIDVYEVTAGIGRMARARAMTRSGDARDDDIVRSLADARYRWLTQVENVFAPELASLDRNGDRLRSIAATVDAAACFEVWDLLANERGIERSELEHLWSVTVTALLNDS